jgi:hypothetical protein
MAQGTRTPQQSLNRTEGSRLNQSAQQSQDITYYLQQYAQENPSAAAMWCFALGFVIGWKLKPW